MPTVAVEPADELALLLAGTAALREARRERLSALARSADLEAFEAFASRLDLLALLGSRLEPLAGDALSHGLRTRLHAHAAEAQRQGVAQELVTIRLLAALEEAGIRALPLKGPLLAERLHGRAGARLSADVDVLVARERLRDAEEVVRALGWRVEPPHEPGDAAAPVLHERLVHPHGLPDVELHWRVHWYEDRFSAELLERSAAGADGWLVPQPADELALLLLLYARDGFAGLRLACDVAAWWDRFGTTLDACALDELAGAHPALSRALATATVVAQRLIGLPAERVLSPALLATASPRAVRLANWRLRGGEAQISANVSLADWLMSPAGQWRSLVRRHVLPSRRELRTGWPEVAARAGGRLRLRLLHPVRLASRYAIAAWTLLRGRAWSPLPAPPEAVGDG